MRIFCVFYFVHYTYCSLLLYFYLINSMTSNVINTYLVNWTFSLNYFCHSWSLIKTSYIFLLTNNKERRHLLWEDGEKKDASSIYIFKSLITFLSMKAGPSENNPQRTYDIFISLKVDKTIKNKIMKKRIQCLRQVLEDDGKDDNPPPTVRWGKKL